MALVKCVECGRQISTLADVCPHCGAPLHHSTAEEDTGSGRDASGCILKLFLIIVVLGLIYLLGKKHIDPQLKKLKETYFKQAEGSGTSGGTIRNILNRNAGGSEDDSDIAEPAEPTDRKSGEAITRGLLGRGIAESKPAEPTAIKLAVPDKPVETPDAPDKPPVENSKEPASEGEETKAVPPPVVEEKTVVAEEAPEIKPVINIANKKADKVDALKKKANERKLKIVAGMSEDADGMLVVIINDNWPILSSDQKKEAAIAIYELWKDDGGVNIEFRNKNGAKVATMNRSANLIHGKMSFLIHDAK